MMIRLSILCTILVLAGCSLHDPTKVELSVTPPPEYLENQAVDEPGLSVDQWWLVFNNERLNRLMTELFAQNLEMTQAIARLEQVEAAFRVTRSAQSPVLAGGASQSRTSQPGLQDDFIGDNQQLSLAAGYELDLWGKLAAQSRAAELELSASRQDVETLYLGLSAR
ncbi:MAG: TolC family protein, partial [Desulfuromonadales bacterium]|nr:TolC family protein [Desulfuromonadales bacterium]